MRAGGACGWNSGILDMDNSSGEGVAKYMLAFADHGQV